MSSVSEKLGLTDDVKKIKLGKSFGKDGESCFHTFRYDFKPASVDAKKMATVDIGEGNQVTVTVPHIDKGSGTTHTVFKGSKRLYQKECVLIIDHKTGEITLEKLNYNVQLKKTRNENGKIKPNAAGDANSLGTKSPMQKLSPQPKCPWSSNRYSPVPKCSPLPKSPNSPPGQVSPSVPSAVVSSSAPSIDTSKASVSISPETVVPSTAINYDAPEIGILTTSDSESSSGSSSESESSDESEISSSKCSSQKYQKVDSQPEPTAAKCSMPNFSNLCEDLQLSDDSDMEN